MAKRSSLEMDVAVLQALSASSHPLIMTHIMYRANVNCKILKRKLAVLEAKGLISSRRVFSCNGHIAKRSYERLVFGLTSKGLDVLRSYLSVYEALGRVEIEQ